MKHTAVVAIRRLSCLHQAARRLATNCHEISGLARIFHPSLLRNPGKPMDAALDLNFDQDSMDSYSPDKNSSSALPHQPSRLSRRESDEISGLDNF